MNLSENDHDLIQKYLVGKASDSEKTIMDSRLTDINFRKELTYQAQLIDALVIADEELVRKDLFREVVAGMDTSRSIKPDPKAVKKGISGIRALSIAASLLFLCTAIWFLFQKTADTTLNYPQMAAAEFSAFPVDGPQRGTTNTVDEVYSAATVAYANKQYTAAIPLFLKLDPQNETIQLYIANCHLGLKEYSSAETILRTLINSSDTAISQNAQWYLGLSELGLDNLEQSKETISQISQNDSHLFHIKATQLLSKMD